MTFTRDMHGNSSGNELEVAHIAIGIHGFHVLLAEPAADQSNTVLIVYELVII